MKNLSNSSAKKRLLRRWKALLAMTQTLRQTKQLGLLTLMGLWLWASGTLYAAVSPVPGNAGGASSVPGNAGGSSPVPGNAGGSLSVPIGMEGKISLDLRGIDILDALKFLTIKVGMNIITTKSVAGKVTLTVNDVPVQDVFDIMLRSNGLAYMKQGDIYNVMTEEEYKAMNGRQFSDLRQVKTFRLQYAVPQQAFTMIDALKSDVGRVLVDPDSGTVMLMDTPYNIKRIQGALMTLEQKNVVRTFTLKYAKAKEVEAQLKGELDGKKAGSIKADERSNQVIVQTLPERMKTIERLIKAIDQKTKEVLIVAKIVKIQLSDALTSGIDWEGLFNESSRLGTTYLGSTPFSVLQPSTAAFQTRTSFFNAIGQQIGAYPSSGIGTGTTPGTPVHPGVLNIGMIDSKKDFNAVVKYLQTIGNTQVLANPRLAVTNNQEAKIHVGQRQAYVTSTTTTGSSTSSVSEQVTFVDVGIQLAVTPTINDDGYVTMKIKPEVSSVVSHITTPSGNTIPIIDTSTAETTVMVKDGTTIILGGMRQDEKDENSNGIPFLSKIPLIGKFFQSGTNTKIRTELLVMLTPHVVTGDTLVTGEEEKEYGLKPGKEYQPYKPLLTDTDLGPNQNFIEQRMKSYESYGDLNPPIKKLAPAIKGDISE